MQKFKGLERYFAPFKTKVAKDTIKVVLIIFLLNSVMAALSYLYGILAIQSLSISMEDISTFENKPLPDDPQKVMENITKVTTLAFSLTMPLAFFYVFFSNPPKEGKHVVYCTVLITLIFNVISMETSPQRIFLSTITIIFFIFLPWIGSIAWHHLHKKHRT